ncbi:hypothetical protein [Enterococcus sp. AZ051]|uniref:hypothetical protein n=1 Tax=unclassified Enterococcus TaxID=2608891 RepID=UPI003D27D3C8
MKVTFNQNLCNVEFLNYADNDNVAIQLVTKRKGKREDDLIATATVNTDLVINQNFVAIKGWSENTGIEQALIDAGVICSSPVGAVRCGMEVAKVFELTRTAIEHKISKETEQEGEETK